MRAVLAAALALALALASAAGAQAPGNDYAAITGEPFVATGECFPVTFWAQRELGNTKHVLVSPEVAQEMVSGPVIDAPPGLAVRHLHSEAVLEDRDDVVVRGRRMPYQAYVIRGTFEINAPAAVPPGRYRVRVRYPKVQEINRRQGTFDRSGITQFNINFEVFADRAAVLRRRWRMLVQLSMCEIAAVAFFVWRARRLTPTKLVGWLKLANLRELGALCGFLAAAFFAAKHLVHDTGELMFYSAPRGGWPPALPVVLANLWTALWMLLAIGRKNDEPGFAYMIGVVCLAMALPWIAPGFAKPVDPDPARIELAMLALFPGMLIATLLTGESKKDDEEPRKKRGEPEKKPGAEEDRTSA